MKLPSKRVYKFTSFNDYSISALASSSVWFSSVKELNDPFEAFYVPKKLSEDEKVSQYIKIAQNLENDNDVVVQRYMNNPEDFMRKISCLYEIEQKSRIKKYNSVSVFSTSMDTLERPPYADILMWAHYGNALSGYCLEFDSEKLYKSLKSNDSKLFWGTIIYEPVPYEIEPIDFYQSSNEDYIKPLLYKHRNWINEQELRFISEKNGLHSFSNESLKNIYVGEKMPEGQVNVILALANVYFPDVNVIKVSMSPNGYGIIKTKI